jgi:hypothetical protein
MVSLWNDNVSLSFLFSNFGTIMPIFQLSMIISPEQAAVDELLKLAISKQLHIDSDQITQYQKVRQSVDARGHAPKIQLVIDVATDPDRLNNPEMIFHYDDVHSKEEVVVIGAGPAGLFAALRLIELGLKPVILERGKEVSERKKDIAILMRNQGLNPESNYCFGEGGAGTFSDGKLYTRSTKKGDVKRILSIFHFHGAQDEIMFEAHPHLGTDRLPVIIKNIRQTILSAGGEIHFASKVIDLVTQGNKIAGVKLEDGSIRKARAVVLATGHSARDVYEMLHRNGLLLEPKGFAMGVRIEHPQSLIDSIQYHQRIRSEFLPAASYSLVDQVNGRGVYSFCMCPGGHIVSASTGNQEIVVNGMSASKRNSPFANSGLVVEIRPEDIPNQHQEDVFAGLRFQQSIESLAFINNGGNGQTAPAQRVADFVKGKLSGSLPECSYLPGTLSSPLHFWLPEMISKRLQEGLKHFDRKMHGFVTNEAVLVGVESRSSSPLRIPRDRDTMQHVQMEGLFPCGEGAGFAGGITSSAIDGENCALAVERFLKGNQ